MGLVSEFQESDDFSEGRAWVVRAQLLQVFSIVMGADNRSIRKFKSPDSMEKYK